MAGSCDWVGVYHSQWHGSRGGGRLLACRLACNSMSSYMSAASGYVSCGEGTCASSYERYR